MSAVKGVPGETVWVRGVHINTRHKWYPAKIFKTCKAPNMYFVGRNGCLTHWCNAVDLRPRSPELRGADRPDKIEEEEK